jgi:3-deoxy-manno-octulosonate cytidylyltransferase (CMP-KDO synthetase)
MLGAESRSVRAPRVIVIPARHASARFPGKPLATIRGADGKARALVEWSHAAARAVSRADRVLVATDDHRIAREVRSFGGDVMMTSQGCANGTERVAACLDRLPGSELLINLQGDALLTPPSYVDALIAHMDAHPDAMVGTVAMRCTGDTYRHLAEDAAQGRIGGTTVVLDGQGRALYFSKRILPYLAPGAMWREDGPVLLHVGLYAYRPEALRRYVAAGPCMLELAEGLEQLRFLYHGIPMSVLVLPAPAFPIVEVNNPSDVAIVEDIMGRHGLS